MAATKESAGASSGEHVHEIELKITTHKDDVDNSPSPHDNDNNNDKKNTTSRGDNARVQKKLGRRKKLNRNRQHLSIRSVYTISIRRQISECV